MGPLHGFKIVEIAGIGPGQLCGMLLADMGAQLIRVARPADDDSDLSIPARYDIMNRSRPTLAVDLKNKQGVELVLRLCEDADALFEGYRPGVMERLGLGPSDCMAKNERLVYGRMTGWGQDGPLADAVGHDTNFIALAGALNSIGDKDRPPPIPLNLVADFGGGALYLAMGMLAAMLEATRSGKGQVVDAAMVDGVASMMTLFYGLMANGMWTDSRQSNFLDGAAPFAKTYETKDGKYIAVCAIETRFFKALLESTRITEIDASDQHKSDSWAKQDAIFAARFKEKTRDEWSEVFKGTDSCAAPVLSISETPQHPHSEARNTYVTVDGITQPGPAPRFSRTPSAIKHGPMAPGERDHQVLSDWGLSEAEIKRLLTDGAPWSKSTV
ncbi:MAG: CoA transferase [Gammaproteobacteria bacterium]|nr:CoA transferase [Gammaproteobacteria bacterium]NNC57719.1 CoA transferase [Woeseiaceae bacterium]